jgi:hypothetical protein
VKEAVETRRDMRRARRSRKWRRPQRSQNRLNRTQRLPLSTRSRWEAKARMISQLKKILPLNEVIIEDVKAVTRQGKGRPWNASFSPVQVGKQHLYHLLTEMGVTLHLKAGWQTKALREQYGLTKTKDKSAHTFASHAVDAWVLAASISGADKPSCTRLWYVVPAILHRRQLHRLKPAKGGKRPRYGGTRSLGIKRGTLVRHPTYGLCTVGGCDLTHSTISLNAYRTNKRLTQKACIEDCCVLTWVAFRSFFVTAAQPNT